MQLLDEAIKSIINSWVCFNILMLGSIDLQSIVRGLLSVGSALFQVDWPYGGMVSKYFYDAFMKIWKTGMKEDMSLLRAQYPNYDVWVSIFGHYRQMFLQLYM